MGDAIEHVERRIEALLDTLADRDDDSREVAEELVRALLELYGQVLGRVVEAVADDPDTQRRLAADPLVAGVLALHDLHPVGLEERIQAALDAIRPRLPGNVAFGGVDANGVARLRLLGPPPNPGDGALARLAVERAVADAAPELTRVDCEGFVPVATGGGDGVAVTVGPTRSASAGVGP